MLAFKNLINKTVVGIAKTRIRCNFARPAQVDATIAASPLFRKLASFPTPTPTQPHTHLGIRLMKVCEKLKQRFSVIKATGRVSLRVFGHAAHALHWQSLSQVSLELSAACVRTVCTDVWNLFPSSWWFFYSIMNIYLDERCAYWNFDLFRDGMYIHT